MKNETIFPQIFPQGDRLPEEFSRYFTGQAYLASISNNEALGTHISNVTFEPGCRNNWHSHTGGQLLLVTAGRGYYQEKGEPARELRPGDVVEIPADVVHWHGAAPDSWFSHLAVECNPAANVNTWLEPVGDAEYEAATAMSWCRPGLSAAAVKNAEMWFPGEAPAFVKTDPELAEVFGNFAFDEVQRYGKLDVKTRILVTMASSLAQQAAATYEMTLRAALANGVAPVAILSGRPLCRYGQSGRLYCIDERFFPEKRCRTAFGAAGHYYARNENGEGVGSAKGDFRRRNRTDV